MCPSEESPPPDTGQPRALPLGRIAQNAGKLALSIEIDRKRNSGFVKADEQFHSYVYEAAVAGGTVKI